MKKRPSRAPLLTPRSPAYCLDITRLVSRAGRGPFTGIDRVELAYLDGLLSLDVPVFGLTRTALGYILVDRAALTNLQPQIYGQVPSGPVDMLGRLRRRLPEAQARAEADLRRHAVGRCVKTRLTAMLRARLPAGTAYLNTGHSNLSRRTLSQVAHAGMDVAVLVHDVIPLDLPHTQRPGTVESFARRMAAVEAHADTIICATEATQKAIARHLEPAKASFVTAPLGVSLSVPRPSPKAPDPPYMLAVGTIDARKNQALLLDVWDDLHARMGLHTPTLILAGSRGWGDAGLMARLNTLAKGGQPVREMPGLSDGEIAHLMSGATALLHPSLAEGFGFPVIEAALRGIPIICQDLPVYRETVGDIPVYVPSTGMYHWCNAVDVLLNGGDKEQATTQERAPRPHHPTWDSHLETVLAVV